MSDDLWLVVLFAILFGPALVLFCLEGGDYDRDRANFLRKHIAELDRRLGRKP